VTTTAPYGSWRSPITASSLVAQAVGLSQVVVDGDDVYWNESRPSEDGRVVVVRSPGVDVLPAGFSARTLVHEYGGQSYAVRDGVIWFSNFADQRLYRLEPGGDPVAITDEAGARYADPVVSPDGEWVVCVRERHGVPGASEAVNDIVRIPSGGGSVEVVASGHDFFAAPRISPDGRSIAWLSWDHPNMPWDGTDLWVDGTKVAGGQDESITQPKWSPTNALHFTSDRSGWWNLMSHPRAKPPPRGGARGGRDFGALANMEAEFSGPDWVFGQSTYAFVDDGGDGTLVAVWSSAGGARIGVVRDGGVEPIDVPFTTISSVQAVAGGVVAIAGSATSAPAVVRIAVPSGEVEVLKRSRSAAVDPAYLSVPQAIEFPTTGGLTAHALFYPPRNDDFAAPAGERPPLIVMSHGGPTSATSSILNLSLQFWTSRGFAVVDVNYGGSTGYGRAYRQRLQGAWGVVDVDDCVNAARWLAGEGLVDGDRMVIRGGSAGGYTTLAALTFRRDVFAAGASHYGVADLEVLALDTHKFESRYLDGLIGPYPAARDVYVERSPIHHTSLLDRPMILFQGLDDKVVPPEQAEMMASALRDRGVPFAYVAFEGEQHGFRSAATIVRVAEAELWFYGRVLGFGPADEIEPVRLENEEGLRR
jgi:dipeptidyl aminopeptidase/acylaminoacyl peptidase